MTNIDKKIFGGNQGGYASFVITLITLIVVSLIVIAFASDSRVTQKNSLANNLATEAYYAAQSGINDAYNIIEAEINNGDVPASTGPNCATAGSTYLQNNSNQIASNGQVSYSCLIVNSTPNSLEYKDIVPGRSLVVPIADESGANINTITISWEYYQATVNGSNLTFIDCPSASYGAGANLPTLNGSGLSFNPTDCGAPLMQVDFVSAANIATAGSLPYGTFFLEPTQNGGGASDPTVNASSEDAVYHNYCNEASPAGGGLYACTQTFVPGSGSDSTYYLHIQTFYQPANISITATDNSGAVSFTDAQIAIDATGDASGQLKRLEERVCYGEFCDSVSPDGAVQSTQCINKEFTVYPGDPSNLPGGC